MSARRFSPRCRCSLLSISHLLLDQAFHICDVILGFWRRCGVYLLGEGVLFLQAFGDVAIVGGGGRLLVGVVVEIVAAGVLATGADVGRGYCGGGFEWKSSWRLEALLRRDERGLRLWRKRRRRRRGNRGLGISLGNCLLALTLDQQLLLLGERHYSCWRVGVGARGDGRAQGGGERGELVGGILVKLTITFFLTYCGN